MGSAQGSSASLVRPGPGARRGSCVPGRASPNSSPHHLHKPRFPPACAPPHLPAHKTCFPSLAGFCDNDSSLECMWPLCRHELQCQPDSLLRSVPAEGWLLGTGILPPRAGAAGVCPRGSQGPQLPGPQVAAACTCGAEVIPSRNRLTNPVSQRSSPWQPHVAERHTEVAGRRITASRSLASHQEPWAAEGPLQGGNPQPRANRTGPGLWLLPLGDPGGQGRRREPARAQDLLGWGWPSLLSWGPGGPAPQERESARELETAWLYFPKASGGNTDLAEALHSDPKRPETLPQRGLRLSPCHAPLLQVLTPRLRQ